MLLWLVPLNVFLLVSSNPFDSSNRQRRWSKDSDVESMEEYWRKPLSLGFFVNDIKSETGDTPDAGALSVRNRIYETQEGSGVGRRDDIERKPTSSATLKHDDIESNEKIDKLEDKNKLDAKVEKSGEKSEGVLPLDPGDKTKVRHSITCQGQKEWLQCDGPYELIRIKNAFWGRDDEQTCTKSSVTHGLRTDKTCAQDESNTMTKVREACDNENVCEVVASGIYFDKTDCPDVYKYLKMEWQCAPSESRIKESINKK